MWNSVVLIDDYGNENLKLSLSMKDQKALEEINEIGNWSSYEYQYLFNANTDKCICRNAFPDFLKKNFDFHILYVTKYLNLCKLNLILKLFLYP